MTIDPRSSVRRLAIARLISVTGGAAAYTALMSTIFERTGESPFWLSMTLLLTFGVTGFIGPFAGVLGDRFDRRRVLLVSDGAAAVAFLAMSLVDSPAPLLALAFCSAVAEAPFVSTSRAAIPNLVEHEEDISWANSWVSVGWSSGITIGPAIGGVLVAAVGPGWVFFGNALTFLVSFALVWSVRRSFSEQRAETPEEEHRGAVAGFRFIAHDRVLLTITAAWAVMVLGLGMGMVADRPLAEEFGAGSAGFGLIISAWGFGSVLGSLLGRRLTSRSERLWLVLGTAVIGVTGLGMGLSPLFWPVIAFVFVNGIGDGISMVADQGITQRRTPDAVRSRVMAASDAVWQITLAAGFVLAGPALTLVSAQGLYTIAGVAALVATGMLLPVLRGTPSGVGARVVGPEESAAVHETDEAVTAPPAARAEGAS
jgi:MFS family permease